MNATDAILEHYQLLQLRHDEAAHRDILSFDLYKRLTHMVLHFCKYAGKVEAARLASDENELRHTLIDAWIICMASANALNLRLGSAFPEVPRERTLDGLAHANAKRLVGPELFAETVSALILISGKMAKVMESTDHMEDGNPRALMKPLVLQMAGIVLGSLGCMAGSIEADVRKRLTEVEQKSIFWRADANPAQ